MKPSSGDSCADEHASSASQRPADSARARLQRRAQAAPLRHGLLFGTAVWAMSYVQLVPMGLYELPWKYAPKEIAMEVGYHLAYGVGVASTLRVLNGR